MKKILDENVFGRVFFHWMKVYVTLATSVVDPILSTLIARMATRVAVGCGTRKTQRDKKKQKREKISNLLSGQKKRKRDTKKQTLGTK